MESQPEISVVIPSFNRSQALGRTLMALQEQTLPAENFEVILVDDGSNEDLRGLISDLHLSYHLTFLRQEKHGPAAARNRGAKQASSEIILFLDSDMIATPELLKEHLKSHTTQERLLVVGPRSPYQLLDQNDPFLTIDYMQGGKDLRFQKIPLTFQEAFTCNLSMHIKDWSEIGGFDEQFPTSSFEDIEFAYRAICSGMSIVWNENALAMHNHLEKMTDRCKRAVSYTSTVSLLFKKHPELIGKIVHLRDKEPINWQKDKPGLILRKLARGILAFKPILDMMDRIFICLYNNKRYIRCQRFLYWKIIGSYQYIGLREGYKIFR